MSEEFLYPEFETKWSNSEIIDMLFDWAKFCMKNKTGDLSNDTAEYFSDKLKAKIAVCSPITPPTTEEAELWKEVINNAFENGWDMPSLFSEYKLSRRSEQNSEAIEFAEWATKNGWYYEPDDNDWFNNDDEELPYKSSAELYQEFQLFKQKQ